METSFSVSSERDRGITWAVTASSGAGRLKRCCHEGPGIILGTAALERDLGFPWNSSTAGIYCTHKVTSGFDMQDLYNKDNSSC